MVGTVKWFDVQKGFGFIVRDDGGGDVFVHHTAVQSTGFKELHQGDSVEFEIVSGSRGPKAAHCKVMLSQAQGSESRLQPVRPATH